MTDDFQGDPGGTLFTSRRNRHGSPFPPFLPLAFLVIIVVAAGAGWLWLRSRGTPEAGSSAVADSKAPATEEPFLAPVLGASDAAVRRLAAAVSSHPKLAAWLATDELIRRFVTAVVDISRGSSPVPALEVLIPEEPFSVQRSGDRLVMDPRSQRRYDLLAEVFASVDADEAAETYHRLLPLFREAYGEMGLQDGEFEEVLARAIGNLLAVQVPDGPLEVKEATERYVYADERIESLTPAEKHMIRLGPENAGRIQEKIREIAERLDLPPVD